MANQSTRRGIKGNRNAAAKFPMIQRGHNDYLAGRPYPREYDTWKEFEQRNYEAARLYAANMLAAGITPPVWREGVTLPRDYSAKVHAANLAVGRPCQG